MTKNGPKVLFAAGPGDVQGTYRFWRDGNPDTTIPNVGYSAQVYDMVRAIGGQVMVVTTHGDAVEEADGFASFRKTIRRGGRGLAYHRTALQQALQVRRLIADYNPDILVVQATLDHAWLLAGVQCQNRIASIHNTLWPSHRAPNAKERLLNRLNARFYRSCAKVFCISESTRAQVQSLPGVAQDVPVVQIPYYRPEAMPQPRPSGPPGALARLIYTGRIVEEKGVFDLLDVVEALPETRLDVIGGGPALERLQQDVAARGLAERVTLQGQLPGEATLAQVAEADVLICPTRGHVAEGLAKTPIEAAILGVPSVVSKVVPSKDVLKDACHVVPADDIPALIAGVRQCLVPETYLRMASGALELRDMVLSGHSSLRSGLLRTVQGFGYEVHENSL